MLGYSFFLLNNCKWMNLKKQQAQKILNMLEKKSSQVKIPEKIKKINHGIVAKSINSKEDLRKSGYIALDLDDLQSALSE